MTANGVEKLTELFRRFPGIGPRQAKRFVYFLLGERPAYLKELTDGIVELKKSVRECPECHRFFNSTSAALCTICKSEQRDRSTLLLVEKDVDLDAMEKSGVYNGVYFVLGGTVPLLEDKRSSAVRLTELSKRIADLQKTGLSEVILAFSVTTEGEYTIERVTEIIRPLAEQKPFKITLLGRGLSTGSEVEYADSDTLKSALEHRT